MHSRHVSRAAARLDFALNLSNARAVLISAGALIDGTGSTPLRPGAVLIEGDRIRAAGTRIDVGADVTALDFPDGTITPGLIDCHVHLSDAGLADASVQDRDPSALRVLRMAEHARRTLARSRSRMTRIANRNASLRRIAIREPGHCEKRLFLPPVAAAQFPPT